jgi:anti-sigma factor RsiW
MYRDGSEPELTEAMRQHLAACLECRRHDRAFRRGVNALRRDLIAPSSDFERRLEDRLARLEAGEPAEAPRVSPLMATAAAVLLITLVVLTLRRPAMIATAAAEADPPSVARPVAMGGIPFVAFLPGP